MKLNVLAAAAARVLCLAVVAALGGCSSFSDYPMKPSVPTQARESFGKLVTDGATARHKADSKTPITATMDDVHSALSQLVAGTWSALDTKDRQVWAGQEVAATGGFFAVLGKIADKTGLTNTGIAAVAGGLSVDKFYDPVVTKNAHSKAMGMWICVQQELVDTSETQRGLALQSSSEDARKAATSAVYDSIRRIDDAVARYRALVSAQQTATPSQADLQRFLSQYVSLGDKAASLRANAELAVTKAQKNLFNATAEQQAADAAMRDSASTKVSSTKNALIEVQRESAADVAGARFVDLNVRLESCVKTAGL